MWVMDKRNSPEIAYRRPDYDDVLRRARTRRMADPSSALFFAARNRAKRKGIEFTLTKADIVIPEFCPVLGIPLFLIPGKRTPNSPTLDRVRTSGGYTPDNIVIISWRANYLKGDATLEELALMAKFYKRFK